MTAERVDARTLVSRLESLRVSAQSGLAFDADGTLWAGDVGEDVFEVACERGLLRTDATDALARVAQAHAIGAADTPSETAGALFKGYRDGVVAEPLMCEVMAWCYAGFSPDELRELAQEAFTLRGLRGRRRGVLDEIHAWAEREGLRVIVVSASPVVIVEEALRTIGLSAFGLAAATPNTAAGRIAPGMAEPLTYGPGKPIAGRRLLGGHDWLGSFGDNAFDVDMLRAARIGVAVCPKAALLHRLAELSNTVVLE